MPTKMYLSPTIVPTCLFESTAYPLIKKKIFLKARMFWKHGVMLKGRLPTIEFEKFTNV